MEDQEFEFDFCVAANMLLGRAYDEAVKEAREWLEEANDDNCLLRGNDYMSDWMNDEWQDFVDVQRIDTDAMPPEALKLLKEAWLHGARAAIAIAKDMVDEFAAKPI